MTQTNLENVIIPRHKAALKRHELSLPMAAAVDGGILLPHHTHLDYGCGRGDDVRFLQAMGFRSRGYDPYYFPRTLKRAVDVVTLLYVLSTIEVPALRCEVLYHAYQLARQTLVVSAITGRSTNHAGVAYNDGVITRWGTFEKCYSHIELKHLIEDTLGVPARYLAHNTYTVSHNSRALPLIIHSSDRTYLEKCRFLLHCQQQELGSAWIPPADAIIEKHSSLQKGKRYYYFRLKSRSRSLPNGKLTMHLGTAQSECYLNAVGAMERRDLLCISERRLIRIEAILSGMSE
ncbi:MULTISPECIES: DNA phosphorothioation-associated putative methyltransferase [unclassified Microcoleus]|uniref:DNA phosphorothioation-associated putative methyltransferase n=1 Tax=unclassified Microcoleus TaxID=2642155 RepID=UPI002FD5B6FC